MCAAECAVRFEPICASMGFVDTSAERFRAVFGGGQAIEESGERGRNRTYNLLIIYKPLKTIDFSDFPRLSLVTNEQF